LALAVRVPLDHRTELAGLTLYFLQLPQQAVAAVAQVSLLMAQRFLAVQVAAAAVVQALAVVQLGLPTKDVLVVMQFLQMAQVVAVVQALWEVMALVLLEVAAGLV
jgi:hypothetical protein